MNVSDDLPKVIHIKAPHQETFTLGQFFAEWKQPFRRLGFLRQLHLTSGWTRGVNGHSFHGSSASMLLAAHALMPLAFNSPNVKPDLIYDWNGL